MKFKKFANPYVTSFRRFACVSSTLFANEWNMVEARIQDTCPNGRLTENVFPPTRTLKHRNLFGKTKWRHFSDKCPDSIMHICIHT